MLDIYGVCLEAAQDALRIAKQIPNANLADQLERAGTSIPLNVSEGAYSKGGNRRSRYHIAMGSAGEAKAVFDIAERAVSFPPFGGHPG